MSFAAVLPFEQLVGHEEFVSLRAVSELVLDLRYATPNNFVGRNLYSGFDAAFLHRDAAAKLHRASALLTQRFPGWQLKVLDALRPGRVQRVLWSIVEGTPMEVYVANPALGSIHSFGMAVDVTLQDEAGREADMGTPFDDFTELAQPQCEPQMRDAGRLSATQLANRLLLRDCMQDAGFLSIRSEWWHFDGGDRQLIRHRFVLVE